MNERTRRVVILDSEGLARAGRHDREVGQRLAAARDNGQRVILPAVVSAEVMTGRPTDAGVYRADPDDLRLLTESHDVRVISL